MMQHRCSHPRRSPVTRPLTLAVLGSLLVVASLPVGAADERETWRQQRQLQAAWSKSVSAPYPADDVRVGKTAPSTAPFVQDSNPASWHSDEFNADWGLAAIGADYAYARGLSGKGVRLGLLDSGAELAHPEFASKNHRGIVMAEMLADGSRCAEGTIVAGPDACFYSRGDEASLIGFMLDPSLKPFVPDGDYDRLVLAFQIHGTHVAGTIAANRDGAGMHGVAFGADLSSARLFNNSFIMADLWCVALGWCTSVSTQADETAFIHMYEQAINDGVKAMNHSWGYQYTASTPEQAKKYHDELMNDPGAAARLTAMADASRRSGMIQVVAAGNSGTNDTPERSPQATMPASLPVVFPDIEQYWVSVVNLTDSSLLSDVSMKCGITAEWCIAAPGTQIYSTVLDELAGLEGKLVTDANGNKRFDLSIRGGTPGYNNLTGTSMAAPHVTGALGLLFERFPYLSGAQVRDVMLTTATDLGDTGVDDVYGWGLLNLKSAIEGYGSLRVDTHVVMNQRAGGLKVWEGDAWDDWTNNINGPGKLTKDGIGWLRLSGDNSFHGAVVREGVLELDGKNALSDSLDVHGGHLLLNGQLAYTTLNIFGGTSQITGEAQLLNSDLNVADGVVSFDGTQSGGSAYVGLDGMLQGVGRLGSTTVEGSIAPGNSIGTLTIDGDYRQTKSGTLIVELAPGGSSDLLHVLGKADLAGNLTAVPEPGVYYLGETFNFLHANGGLNGGFVQSDFSAFSPFLRFSVAYGAESATIDVTRGQMLATAAATANQTAVAKTADLLDINQGLPKPLTLLFPDQLGGALDALSGEIHAATPLVLVEGSRHVRNAALGRVVEINRIEGSDEEIGGAWVQAIGGSGKLDGNANAALTDANASGLLVGLDHSVDAWQIGMMAGSGRTDVKQASSRVARSTVDSTHVGLYAGRLLGGFGLRGGISYSRHDADSTRQVSFAGFSDSLSASYDASTRQAFTEVAYRFGSDDAGLEPYLQLTRVEVDVDQVNERGHAAALRGQVDDTGTTLGTIGVRFDKGLKASFQENSWLDVRGGIGYRRASDDLDQVARLQLDGGNVFEVGAAPIAENSMVAEMGLSARISSRQQLELGYTGQFGEGNHDHGLSARWSLNL